MIVSHKYKFIYIAVPKTASTSLGTALQEYCEGEPLISPKLLAKNPDFVQEKETLPPIKKHMPARKIKKLVGPKIWKEYFKFTIERNPFDKLVSYYFMKKSDEKHSCGNSFKEFVLNCKNEVRNFPKGANIYSLKGEIALDYIGHFETLEKDLDFICKKLGLPNLNLGRKKSGFRPDRDYRKYYDEETKEIVSKHYAKEIEAFGYKF